MLPEYHDSNYSGKAFVVQHEKVFEKTASSIHYCEDFLLSTLHPLYDDLNECAPDDLYFGIDHDTLSKNIMEYGFWPKHSLSVTH